MFLMKSLDELVKLREGQIETLKERLSYLTAPSAYNLTVSYTTDLTLKEQIRYCNVGIFCFLLELKRYESNAI